MSYGNAHKIANHLWLGNYLAAKDLKFLKDNNIKLVVNCSNNIDNFYEGTNIQIQYIRIPVDDSLLKKDFIIMMNYLPAVTQIINYVIQNNQNVLVHCYAGMQRSACVVAAYLMYYHKIKLYDAILYIQSIRPIAFTPQVNFIEPLLIFQNYSKHLK